MPRTKSGSLPTSRLSTRTGQAIVTINGRDYSLGSHGSVASKEKYNRLLAEWLEGGQATAPAVDLFEKPKLAINEMILAYVKHARIYYQDAPKERSKIALALRPLKPLYGRTEANSFGPLALQVVRDDLLKPQERVFRRKVQKDEETVVEERRFAFCLARRGDLHPAMDRSCCGWRACDDRKAKSALGCCRVPPLRGSVGSGRITARD